MSCSIQSGERLRFVRDGLRPLSVCDPVLRSARCAALLAVTILMSAAWTDVATAEAGEVAPSTAPLEDPARAEMSLAEIESCASENLPGAAGVIGFRVDAMDRSGTMVSSKAELRWRKPEDAPMRVLLEVSEPAKTAGTALLIIERDAAQPEFFVRLPEMKKVKKVRSRRLRGPVLGTDFSYEDLDRLRSPLDKTSLDLIGSKDIAGRPAWILETIPSEDDASEYSRVLTYVDYATCLPIRIDLFEPGVDGAPRLRKQLEAPREAIRSAAGAGDARLPFEFVMRDLRRESRTVVRIEHFDATDDLPAEQFTRAALQDAKDAAPAAPH